MGKMSYNNNASIKKYYLPIILLIVIVNLNALHPELSGIIKFLKLLLYFSLVKILVFQITISSKPEIKLLKWTLAFGLILPIYIKDVGLLNFDPINLAIIIILVPILFHELLKETNGEKKPCDLQKVSQITDKDLV